MKKVSIPALNIPNTLGVVAVGAATGAIAGTAALITYGLLSGKGAATLLAAKSTLGLKASTAQTASFSPLLSLLMPAVSIGALSGGTSSLLVRKQAQQQATEKFQQKNNALHQQVQTLENQVSEAQQIQTTTVHEVITIDLEKIKGIGPKFSLLLQQAGIYTIETLAQQDAKQLRTILEASSAEQLFKVEDWVEQAQHMMKKSK